MGFLRSLSHRFGKRSASPRDSKPTKAAGDADANATIASTSNGRVNANGNNENNNNNNNNTNKNNNNGNNNGRASANVARGAPEPFNARRQCQCKVLLLDGTDVSVVIQKKALGQAIYDHVFELLDLEERDYFGLQYTDHYHVHHWLDPLKKVHKQAAIGPPYTFRFRVKFYSSEPSNLKEESTRYQFFLQLKQDIQTGTLFCAKQTAVELAAFALQSEFGDFNAREHTPAFVSEFRFHPLQDEAMESAIIDAYAAPMCRAMAPADAELAYLNRVKHLDLYGVDMHVVEGKDGNQYRLGLTPTGMLVFDGAQKIGLFFWGKIQRLDFRNRRLTLVVEEDVEEDTSGQIQLHTFVFELTSHKACKHLWKCAIEHHTFFRLKYHKPPRRAKGRLFRLGSTFKYRGRTEYENVHCELPKDENMSRNSSVNFQRRASQRYAPRQSYLARRNFQDEMRQKFSACELSARGGGGSGGGAIALTNAQLADGALIDYGRGRHTTVVNVPAPPTANAHMAPLAAIPSIDDGVSISEFAAEPVITTTSHSRFSAQTSSPCATSSSGIGSSSSASSSGVGGFSGRSGGPQPASTPPIHNSTQFNKNGGISTVFLNNEPISEGGTNVVPKYIVPLNKSGGESASVDRSSGENSNRNVCINASDDKNHSSDVHSKSEKNIDTVSEVTVTNSVNDIDAANIIPSATNEPNDENEAFNKETAIQQQQQQQQLLKQNSLLAEYGAPGPDNGDEEEDDRIYDSSENNSKTSPNTAADDGSHRQNFADSKSHKADDGNSRNTNNKTANDSQTRDTFVNDYDSPKPYKDGIRRYSIEDNESEADTIAVRKTSKCSAYRSITAAYQHGVSASPTADPCQGGSKIVRFCNANSSTNSIASTDSRASSYAGNARRSTTHSPSRPRGGAERGGTCGSGHLSAIPRPLGGETHRLSPHSVPKTATSAYAKNAMGVTNASRTVARRPAPKISKIPGATSANNISMPVARPRVNAFTPRNSVALGSKGELRSLSPSMTRIPKSKPHVATARPSRTNATSEQSYRLQSDANHRKNQSLKNQSHYRSAASVANDNINKRSIHYSHSHTNNNCNRRRQNDENQRQTENDMISRKSAYNSHQNLSTHHNNVAYSNRTVGQINEAFDYGHFAKPLGNYV